MIIMIKILSWYGFNVQAPGDLWVKLGIKSNYSIYLRMPFGSTCIIDVSLKQINKGQVFLGRCINMLDA